MRAQAFASRKHGFGHQTRSDYGRACVCRLPRYPRVIELTCRQEVRPPQPAQLVEHGAKTLCRAVDQAVVGHEFAYTPHHRSGIVYGADR